MCIIVQKFGGTSVATPKGRHQVVQKIKKTLEKGKHPVVVVSAMGRKGQPYATDTLIDFVAQNGGSMTKREYDLLVSCGEIISAVNMTALLQKNGIKAKAFTGGGAGIITDDDYQAADLIYTKPKKLMEAIEEQIVPVVAGFQGMTTEGEITTLGRGGSDTTAAILGAALKAECIEIYTDVDGIMTADPRVCNKAKIIPAISYHEVFQMADNGARVIHPRAVDYARRANIPLVIKNTFTDEKGTYILQNTENSQFDKENKVITSVAHRCGRVQFKIVDSIFSQKALLEQIAEAGISIDLINIFPEYKIFTVGEEDEEALKILLEHSKYSYETQRGCAKVTAIGEYMTGVPGVMARIIKAFSKAQIHILQTADSLTTIACLIKEEEVPLAVGILHDEFKL